jgi:non-heme chloroperoxidase
MRTLRRQLVLVSILFVTSLLWSAPLTEDRFFKTSDGVRLHYLDSGQGPAIVFVPGWTMPAEIWRSQIQYFRQTHRVIAFDPRSQGESERSSEGNFPGRRAQDIKELVGQLNLSPVVLVGWSLGVREALTYVEMFGTSTLSGLVLVDGEVFASTSPESYRGRAEFLHKVQEGRVEVTETFIHSMFQKPQSKEYLAYLVAEALKTPTDTAVALLAELYLWNDLRPILARVDVPLLYVVRAQHSDQVATVHSTVPAAQTEVFEDAGHALFVDDADRFNDVLQKFLTRTLPESKK